MPKVASAMTRECATVDPAQTVAQAARAMRDQGVGVLPVCEGDKLVGMITDRDIVVRSVAAGKSAESCSVESMMSSDVRCVGSDEDLDDVLIEMSQAQVSRMPVVDSQMRLVGVVSFGDLGMDGRAAAEEAELASELAAAKPRPHARRAALLH